MLNKKFNYWIIATLILFFYLGFHLHPQPQIVWFSAILNHWTHPDQNVETVSEVTRQMWSIWNELTSYIYAINFNRFQYSAILTGLISASGGLGLFLIFHHGLNSPAQGVQSNDLCLSLLSVE